MLDFGALPPEINSARMYTGPGAGPMLAAAAAWDGLAAELESFSDAYSSTVSELHDRHWIGPSATAMAAASAPYAAWVSATARQAERAANQARLAVAAYEAAFAATVPPMVVAANRVLLATLVATNFFGQNTAAIAATEAAYAEMWAQDAAAMYAYAVSASSAAELGNFAQPPQIVNPTGLQTQAMAQQLASQAAAPAAAADPAVSPIISAFETFNTLTGPLVPAYQIPFAVFTAGIFVNGLTQLEVQGQTLPELAAPLGGVAAARATAPAAGTRPVLAHMGHAGSVGGLSTPPSWVGEAPPSVATATGGQPGFRALPPWVHEPVPNGQTGVPAAAQLNHAGGRRGGNAVFRMRDRRYRIPRPAPGG